VLDESLVTAAWHVLRLWMEGRPPDMEGSCEYIWNKDGWQGVALQLGSWACG